MKLLKLGLLLIPLSCGMFFQRCIKETINDDMPFYETQWTLRSLNGKNIEVENKPTVTFNKDKTAVGKSTCNSFGGTFDCNYQTGGAAFDMERVSTTKVFCNDNGLETDFYDLLHQADSVIIKDKILVMYQAKKEKATFISQ